MTENPQSKEDDDWSVTHVVEYEVATTWARMNCMSRQYYRMAEEAYSQFITESRAPVEHPGPDVDMSEYIDCRERILTAAIQTIVFSAMACEAAIYDLAAIHLGDKYAESVLDELDVLGKWLVIPRLICGKSLRPDGPAINGLRTLIPARNALVHHKSMPGIRDPDDHENNRAIEERARRQMARIHAAATPAFQTVVLLSLELNRLLGTVAGVLPIFEHDSASSRWQTAQEVRDTILGCREIDKKASVKPHY